MIDISTEGILFLGEVEKHRLKKALRSFDSVLLFQMSHFLTYDAFLRSG